MSINSEYKVFYIRVTNTNIMGYEIGALAFGLIITAIGIDWKWGREHKGKNIALIIFFILAFIFGVLGIKSQEEKSDAKDIQHKIERKIDSTNYVIREHKMITHIDSITSIHRQDSMKIVGFNTISQKGNGNLMNTGINNGLQIGENNGVINTVRHFTVKDSLYICTKFNYLVKHDTITDKYVSVVMFIGSDGGVFRQELIGFLNRHGKNYYDDTENAYKKLDGYEIDVQRDDVQNNKKQIVIRIGNFNK